VKLAVGVALAGLVTPMTASAAELEERTSRAYDAYAARAKQMFLDRIRGDVPPAGVTQGASREAKPVVRAQGRDGIIEVPGGLMHHWVGAVFIENVSLQRVLDLSRAYSEYRTIYKPIIGSTLLDRSADTFHVWLRLREGAAGVSAVLDIWLNVQYFYPDSRHAHSVSNAEEIREVRNAGEADEQRLSAGRDSGYLWRANSFTNFIERDGGVYVEMETLGLTRRFPPLLGWVLEPIAKRLGRKSVETSLEEFQTAVLASNRKTAQGPVLQITPGERDTVRLLAHTLSGRCDARPLRMVE
jgi:hypothetical protein